MSILGASGTRLELDRRPFAYPGLSFHDLFQNGYRRPAMPPLGISDAEFSEFHRPIFEHLRAAAN
jgi:hypothetical protein